MPKPSFSTFLAATVIAAGFGSAAEAKTLHAVASFTVLADVVHVVGGDHVEVKSLVGPNGDPHVYEPTPNDAKALKEADVVFTSGEGLEGWMVRLIQASGYKGKINVASDGIKTHKMEDDGKIVTDPHVWNDPKNGIIWTQNIVKVLSAADPEDAADFKANGDHLIADLQSIDNYARTAISAIPAEKRKVLTTHDAFGYFGRAYSVTFLAPQGISTEAEASAADVGKLIKQIKHEAVKVYFFENSNDPRLVTQIAKETGAQPGGTLYVESLSPPDGPAPTYLTMLKYNIDLLVAAMSKQST
jgi:zinc/manganese transport system substrate-binding protein